MPLGKNEAVSKTDTKRPPLGRQDLVGVIFYASYHYWSLSSHLQMIWQVTPAMTATKNEAMISKSRHPLPVPSVGMVTWTVYHNRPGRKS